MIFHLYVIKGSASSTFERNAYSWIKWNGHSVIVISFIPIIPTNENKWNIPISSILVKSYKVKLLAMNHLIEWLTNRVNTCKHKKELAGALMWHCPNCSDTEINRVFLWINLVSDISMMMTFFLWNLMGPKERKKRKCYWEKRLFAGQRSC